jgi:hypothetical protein
MADPVWPWQDHGNDARHVIRGEKAPGAEIAVDLTGQGQDGTILRHRRPRDDLLFARVEAGDEVFLPAFLPAHRNAQQARGGRDGEFLAKERDLLAESPTNIRCLHGHLRFPQSQSCGQDCPIGMQSWRAHDHRKVFTSRIPSRQAAAGLQRYVRLAMLAEALGYDARRPGENTFQARRGKGLA